MTAGRRRLPAGAGRRRGQLERRSGTTSAGCSPTPSGCWPSSSTSPPAGGPGARRAPSRAAGPARLDRLARADARLLDAYQAEVISLEELAERRRLRRPSSATPSSGSSSGSASYAAEQRRGAGGAGRPDRLLRAGARPARGGGFADRQAILQLVVERIIVHESSLEIRHVIPLHSPPPGREGPPQSRTVDCVRIVWTRYPTQAVPERVR